MSAAFSEKFKEGTDGEREVGEYFLARGMWVVPLYQYERHDAAPVLFGDGVRYVLPDLDVYTNGRACFVEVKTKHQWVRWNNHLETGFDERLAGQYEHVERATGKPVCLMFLHKSKPPVGLFKISLKSFLRNARRWDGKNRRTGQRVTNPELLCRLEHLSVVDDFAPKEAA